MEKPYKPIACNFHDQLLHYATTKEVVMAILQDNQDNQILIEDSIKDVFTQSGAEFILFKGGAQFRLDRIVKVNDMELKDLHCSIE